MEQVQDNVRKLSAQMVRLFDAGEVNGKLKWFNNYDWTKEI